MGWPLPPGGAGVSNPIHKSSTKFFYRAFGGSVCGETSAVGVVPLLHGGVAYWGEGKKREDGGGSENTGCPWLKKHAGDILVGFAVGLLLRDFFRSYFVCLWCSFYLRLFFPRVDEAAYILFLGLRPPVYARRLTFIFLGLRLRVCCCCCSCVRSIALDLYCMYVNLATVCCVLLMQRDMFARAWPVVRDQ